MADAADHTSPDEPALSAPSHPSDVGTLGKYRVLKLLGKGGMGAVFLGFDPLLDRKVALKVMLPSHAARPAARERFLREARAAARVKSDFVAPIYEVGEDDGGPYLAMEYLRGKSLDQYLREKGRPTVPQAVRIAREAAAGLAAAHDIGLVHRDVKPANLWLEAPRGRVKVLDFGLARHQHDDTALTVVGQVVGTPAFMSPEQARGDKMDHRSDLFSLGVVLYRMLGGRLPFEGSTAMEALIRLTTEDPPPIRTLNPDVPEALADLVHRLLAKDPVARPQTARVVIAALKAADAPLVVIPQPEGAFAGIEGPTEPTETIPATEPVPPPAARRGPSPVLLGVAAVVLVAIAGGVWWASRPNPTPHPDPQPVVNADPGKTDEPNKVVSTIPTTAVNAKPTEPKKKDPPPPPKESPDPLAWRALFDGKEPTGWKVGIWGPRTAAEEDGKTVLRMQPGAWIFTDGDYRNFHLSLEVQTPPKGGPIGDVTYHVVENSSPLYNRGIQLLMVPNVFGRMNLWGGKNTTIVPGEVRGGRVVPRPGAVASSELPTVGGPQRPAGQWNRVEVICLGNTSLHAVNGKVVCAAADLTFRGKPLTEGQIKFNAWGELAVRDVKIRYPITSVPSEFEPKSKK